MRSLGTASQKWLHKSISVIFNVKYLLKYYVIVIFVKIMLKFRLNIQWYYLIFGSFYLFINADV